MKRLCQVFLISILSIMLIPFLITMAFGNNDVKVPKNIEEENKDKIISMMAKAVPVDFEIETIKVQAVISRTYLELLKDQEVDDEEDLYFTKEEMKQLWGKDYDNNYKKFEKAVDETKNTVATYENKPVQLAYHFSNSGFTQSAEDIWGEDIPYLQNVQSAWDKDNKTILQEIKIHKKDFANKINKHYDENLLIAEGIEGQIQIIERTSGGYIKQMQIANKTISGEEFRRILKFSSSCINIKYKEDNILLQIIGKGHGVGLSQYGSNEMAKEDKTYKEIMKYYFADINIKNNN